MKTHYRTETEWLADYAREQAQARQVPDVIIKKPIRQPGGLEGKQIVKGQLRAGVTVPIRVKR